MLCDVFLAVFHFDAEQFHRTLFVLGTLHFSGVNLRHSAKDASIKLGIGPITRHCEP